MNPNSSDNLKPFKKGDNRINTSGRPRGSKNVSTILISMLKKYAPDQVIDSKFVREFCKGRKKVSNADAIAARILKAAIIDAEPWAIREVLDRTEGKSTTPVELSGPDGGALFFEPIIVRPKRRDAEREDETNDDDGTRSEVSDPDADDRI